MENNRNGKKIDTRTLGGWLILIQVFIILNAFSWLNNLQLYYKLLGEKDQLIKDKGVSDPSIYITFIYYELASSLIFTFGTFAVFYYFFKRNSYFPLIMTIYLAAEVLVEGLSFLLFSSIAGESALIWQKLIFSAVISVFIIIYLRVSKRVKVTFIH
jgi:hypothetical protein